MSNGNASFKGVGRYVFSSNNVKTKQLSVTGTTNLNDVYNKKCHTENHDAVNHPKTHPKMVVPFINL